MSYRVQNDDGTWGEWSGVGPVFSCAPMKSAETGRRMSVEILTDGSYVIHLHDSEIDDFRPSRNGGIFLRLSSDSMKNLAAMAERLDDELKRNAKLPGRTLRC